MKQHPAYVFEILRASGDFTLYRRHGPARDTVLGIGLAEHSHPGSLDRLLHEHALAGELHPEWAAVPLALTRHDGRQLLLLNDKDSVPLDQILASTAGGRLELENFLRLSSELARATRHVHAAGLIHKDIKPANVLVDSSGRVRLTGFGIASRLLRERHPPTPPEVIAGTLPYMAPEQTGRMNRSVDSRSDLYSLGVTMYEMLTGTLPFAATDPMEWIHCHVARQPTAPSERMTGVPAAVESIILKLLAKGAEDRYQTAAALEIDLQRCLAAWKARGIIEPLLAGPNDLSDRLVIPEKLYGRESEITLLKGAFQRMVSHGETELALISGYSGVGKSSIVSELHKLLVAPRGLFAFGKFDQYKRDIPYATLAQAFQQLVRQLLNKSSDDLALWRDDLISALGPNGQLMVNLIPELILVVGDQPPLPRVDPQDAANRFYLVLRNFLGVFARHEHPLVLFIDDLQWLDAGTLEMLERLVKDGEVRHLMVIGAYRSNEVGPTHPLAKTLDGLRSARPSLLELNLRPLTAAHVTVLCADALHTHLVRVASLADLVFQKTAGNPFFVIQFITELADEGLLTFDSERSLWQWDADRIHAKGITDNVAVLMEAKLGRLPIETRVVLEQLACLGNTSDVHTLALLRDASEESVETVLRDAVDSGLVLVMNKTLSFIHDRVHEAAYALIPAGSRATAHLRTGRLLLALTPPTDLEEKIFEIVHQFDRGTDAIESVAERELVASLNLIAGKRAKTASAHASAQAYFVTGGAMLGDESRQQQYRLTFDLELNRAECEIVLGQLAAAEDRLVALSQRALNLSDQASTTCLTVLLCFTTGRYDRAVDVALRFLSLAGVEWSPHPTEQQVREEYMEMRHQLSRRPIEGLIDLPAMSDPSCVAIMAVLTELFPAAYAFDRYLLELVLLRMTNLSLEHGNSESSSVAYSALNMALGSHFSDYSTAYSLGQLACELVDRRGMDRYKARVYCCFAAFAMPWILPVSRCIPMLEESFRGGRSMGDAGFAAYTSRVLLTHLLVSGTSLNHVQREIERVFAFVKGVEVGMTTERFIGQLELVQNLRGIPCEHRATDDEWASQDVEQHPSLAMMVCYYWVFRLESHFFAADFPAALGAASHVDGRRWALRSTLEEAEYDFYAGLVRAALADAASPEERAAHVAALVDHHQRISAWSVNCPENFSSRAALLAAEIARLAGRELDAQILYEEAIKLARNQGFLQNEAIGNELAAQAYGARGLESVARAYLLNARDCYERWGALGKVRQIDARYPHLRSHAAPGSLAATISKRTAQLDVETVDRASQTLSSEMILPSLLEKLMRLAVEHAAAEKGLLILLPGDEPHIEAEAVTGSGRVDVAVRNVRVTSNDLPLSALQYVLRTRERIVLDDASAGGLDPDDEYVRKNRPRSVLCLPIFRQTKIIGALYLENNLTTCAFTADRVGVLDFLASQAAIALENARLYSDLRRSETWLTEAQHLSLTGSFYWKVALDTVEFSAQTFRMYELDPRVTVTLELIGTRIHPEDLPILQEMIDIARGPAADLDYLYRVQLPDLSVKHMHLVAHATRDVDGHLAYIGAIQDVTQRRRAEEALGKARSELAHVARVTSLGALTASIAHEVNQPLTGIITNASTCLRMLAAEPPNLEGSRETARRMIRDGNRAADVIKRLRALFTKEDSATEPVDLNAATREVIALSFNELQQGRVVLRAELSEDLPPLTGDRVQLQQVILNLLLNATEAMSETSDRARQLVIQTATADAGHVRLSVRDTGPGIGPEGAEKLFEAFYTTKKDGMGMGLSVSRSIIESHNGRLWAEGNEGPGATFAFLIPARTTRTLPRAELGAGASAVSAGQLTRLA